MRVTSSLIARTNLENIQRLESRLFEQNQQVASGKKVDQASDDPTGSAKLVRLRDEMSRINQFKRNIIQARVQVSSTADALNSVTNLINSARATATQGLSDTSTDDREILARELEATLDELISVSSTSVDGKMLFSGSQISIEPLALVGGVYVDQGDDQALMVQISDNRSIQINATSSEVFTDPSADLVNSIQQLADALRVEDTATATQILDTINSAADGVELVRARISRALGDLDDANQQLDQQMITLTSEVSGIEDADLAKAISDSALTESALSATLSVAGQRQLSLFDVIG
ncbi:MAG: flagellar hook-associated protein FlgL [Acidobacteriota bacterium]